MINMIAPEISHACKVLFGSHTRVSVDFLHSLNNTTLKSAFKKRALETHPDRARLLNKDADKLNELFISVSNAYDKLNSVLDRKQDFQGHQPRPSPGARGPIYRPGFSNHYYKGSMPNTPLLFGRYLYYAGRIPWDTLIAALVWQRKQKPPLGQIAFEAGWLTQSDIRTIVNWRRPGERFGECALRLGYIEEAQLWRVLLRQRLRHKPIGAFIVNEGFVSHAELPLIVRAQRLHNIRAASRSSGKI